MIRLLTYFLFVFVSYSEQRGPPGVASVPDPPSNPVTPAPIRRQPTVAQTTWAPQVDQTNTWQPSQQEQQPQQSNWDQDNQQPQEERWNPEWRDRGPPPPHWRDRGPPPPDFEGWHHRPPWRRGPWWARPHPPWGPPPPGPPPFGWRGL
ncbi:unnamed protein product [Caenorhabditis nigoni]|uniref:Uncharacterized protein n=1 Tax=Caenorhabditis nigoni TaxID=1611254 RepID=A0A2G5TIV8_9PELO|nr:hypothetical protein B9Z55_019554 [Caenorhabditis nigoni]